jgi:hypothetical protein
MPPGVLFSESTLSVDRVVTALAQSAAALSQDQREVPWDRVANANGAGLASDA